MDTDRNNEWPKGVSHRHSLAEWRGYGCRGQKHQRRHQQCRTLQPRHWNLAAHRLAAHQPQSSYGDVATQWSGARCWRWWLWRQRHFRRGVIQPDDWDLDPGRQHEGREVRTYEHLVTEWSGARRRWRRKRPV